MANGNAKPPIPDPTVLTTQQLDKAVECLREIHEARFDGMDTAIRLLQSAHDKLPGLRQEAVDHLEKLHTEKFNSVTRQTEIQFDSVKTQFIERDKRTEQLSLADKTAIAAALQAQKENAGASTEMVIAAITKNEVNFSKLIEQGQTLLMEVKRNTDERINDLKSRLDRGEGKTSVSDPATTETLRLLTVAIGNLSASRDTTAGQSKGAADNMGFIFAFVGMGVAVLSLALLAFRAVT